ncbi:MAG: hypothetical protein U1E51_26945 [Candidatus Binatia bacterium]|nr:hypothetical protein [Candidatus Binatia bacterium]
MIFGNRQIAPPAKRPGDAPNRKLIVNRFPVIGNPVGIFLKPTIKILKTSPAPAPDLPESNRTLTSADGLGIWQPAPPGPPDLKLS